jgi:c-di-GMP-binding flagellar brake protein YcgR
MSHTVTKDDEDILSLFIEAEPLPQPSTVRRWQRVKIEVHIKVRVQKSGRTEFVHGQGNDVSEGGMAAYVPADLCVDDQIEVEIVLPYGKRPVSFSARVCNRNGFRYGLEFVNVAEANRTELLSCLKAFAVAQ